MIKKQSIYESPEVTVTEILAEGVLCASITAAPQHEGWTDEELDW